MKIDFLFLLFSTLLQKYVFCDMYCVFIFLSYRVPTFGSIRFLLENHIWITIFTYIFFFFFFFFQCNSELSVCIKNKEMEKLNIIMQLLTSDYQCWLRKTFQIQKVRMNKNKWLKFFCKNFIEMIGVKPMISELWKQLNCYWNKRIQIQEYFF